MLERPANSGCATSTPESTIVIGLPGPGGVRPATPIAARHHSVPTRGSVKSVTLMVPATVSGVVKRRAWQARMPGQHPRGRVALEPIEPQARRDGGGSGAAKDRGGVTRRGRPELDELRCRRRPSGCGRPPLPRATPVPRTLRRAPGAPRVISHRGENRRAVGGVPDEPAVAHGEPPRCAGRERRGRAWPRSRWRRGCSRAPPAGRSRRHRSRCRGCRWARRRGSRAARRRAPGRSRRAAARRRRGGRGDGRSDRRGRPPRAVPRDRSRNSAELTPTGASPASTFSSAVSVGIRLNCWKTKPNALRRSSASSPSPRMPRSRPSKRTLPELGRSSAPSSCSRVVLPDPLGPSSATNWPASICRSTPPTASIDRGASLEESLGRP